MLSCGCLLAEFGYPLIYAFISTGGVLRFACRKNFAAFDDLYLAADLSDFSSDIYYSVLSFSRSAWNNIQHVVPSIFRVVILFTTVQ